MANGCKILVVDDDVANRETLAPYCRDEVVAEEREQHDAEPYLEDGSEPRNPPQ